MNAIYMSPMREEWVDPSLLKNRKCAGNGVSARTVSVQSALHHLVVSYMLFRMQIRQQQIGIFFCVLLLDGHLYIIPVLMFRVLRVLRVLRV
jgi:hypothetical protein